MHVSRPYDRERETPAKSRVAAGPPREGRNRLGSVEALELEAAPLPGRRTALKPRPTSASVRAMAWPEAQGLAARVALREERRDARRARRLAVLVGMLAVGVVALLVTAFGSQGGELTGATAPAPSQRLLPAGPPRPQIVAMRETLRIQLPIAQARVTAIGYHASGGTTLALEPVGSQANAGVFGRLRDRLFGGDDSGLRYYLLGGGVGPETGGLDVGAPPDTDVYAPVDGTLIALAERIVNGKPYGVRMDIQPSGNPSLVVSLLNLNPDPALTVGSQVTAGRTKVGRVIDVSRVESAALARYTQDEGHHVHVEVRTAASLAR